MSVTLAQCVLSLHPGPGRGRVAKGLVVQAADRAPRGQGASRELKAGELGGGTLTLTLSFEAISAADNSLIFKKQICARIPAQTNVAAEKAGPGRGWAPGWRHRGLRGPGRGEL